MRETRAAWAAVPDDMRSRVRLADLLMDDQGENGAIVNALQRHATVVVQKSPAEDFGLSVAEAMWKHRPVVASRMGGIQDQIEDGASGVLLDDPHDDAAYGAALTRLLIDPALAARLGRTAHEHIRSLFLNSRHLTQYEARSKRCSELGAAATCPFDRRAAGGFQPAPEHVVHVGMAEQAVVIDSPDPVTGVHGNGRR